MFLQRVQVASAFADGGDVFGSAGFVGFVDGELERFGAGYVVREDCGRGGRGGRGRSGCGCLW
jgi:hypothetical protein